MNNVLKYQRAYAVFDPATGKRISGARFSLQKARDTMDMLSAKANWRGNTYHIVEVELPPLRKAA